MHINQDFSLDRIKYIGGSDIGAILGLSKYRTPLEVWMEKTGKETKRSDSLPLRFGSFAESFVASEYSRATGFELLHDESIHIHPTHTFMSAHIDRFILGDGINRPPTRILECKTANPFARGEWGEPGTDQVPMSYLCQCVWYMAITGIEQCDLAVLFGNSDFRIYEIARDLELEALVIEKALHFWNEYVQNDIAPAAQTENDYQTLFKRGDPSKTIEANPKTVELILQL
jgi:putative phage-type endonuclease